MKNIAEVDKNFMRENNISEDAKFFDVREKPFSLYGIYYSEKDGKFLRLPLDVAQNMSSGAVYLASSTAGGRVRFKTDSEYIAVKCDFASVSIYPGMPITGSCCFDMYADGKFVSSFVPKISYPDGFTPSFDVSEGYASILHFGSKKMRDIVINFPTYNAVTNAVIGIDKNAEILEGDKYPNEKPVVFYGSSITQGASASRPGNTYEAVLSRRLDFDYINLGFSGNARAEDAIAEYIANLDMKVFVYDYDHNAPTPEYLKETHYKMFKTIRDKNPDLPVIMLTRPENCGDESDLDKRLEIVKESYEKAISDGDKNVYFISGKAIRDSHDSEMMTVEGCHPNDFGFYCMAEKIEEILKNLL